MKLEVGKTYVNRLGNLCKIVEYDNDPDNVYPYMDNNGREYIETGNFYLIVEDDFDLIEEYKPSVKPTKPLPDIIDPVINEMCWDMVKVIGSKDWFNELKPALYEALKRYHKDYLDKPA